MGADCGAGGKICKEGLTPAPTRRMDCEQPARFSFVETSFHLTMIAEFYIYIPPVARIILTEEGIG
jgi:hypothetical protein